MVGITIENKGGEDYIKTHRGFVGRVVWKQNGFFIIEPIEIGNEVIEDLKGWMRFYNAIAEEYQIVKLLIPIVEVFRNLRDSLPNGIFLERIAEVRKLITFSPEKFGLKYFNGDLSVEIYQSMINDI